MSFIQFNSSDRIFKNDLNKNDENRQFSHSMPVAIQTEAVINKGKIELRLKFNQARFDSEKANYLLSAWERYIEKSCDINRLIVSTSSEASFGRVGEIVPYTYTQLDYWFMYMQTGDSWDLNLAYLLEGDVNVSILKKAIIDNVKKHDIFWTDISRKRPYRKRVMPRNFEVNVYDWRETSIGELANKVNKENVPKAIDLNKPPLINVSVIRFEGNRYVLAYRVSHILFDYTSSQVFLTQILERYESLLTQENPSPLEIENPVLEMAYKERRDFETGKFEKDLNYWKKHLNNVKHYELPRGLEGRPGTEKIAFPKGAISQFKKICEDRGISLQMGFLALLGKALFDFNQKNDIVIKIIINERSQWKKKNSIGPILREVPIYFRYEEEDTFETLGKKVQSSVLNAVEHRHLPWIIPLSILEKNRWPKIYKPLFKASDWVSQKLAQMAFPKAELYPKILSNYVSFLEVPKFSWSKVNSEEMEVSLNMVLQQDDNLIENKPNHPSIKASLLNSVGSETSVDASVGTWQDKGLNFTVFSQEGTELLILNSNKMSHTLRTELLEKALELFNKEIREYKMHQ